MKQFQSRYKCSCVRRVNETPPNQLKYVNFTLKQNFTQIAIPNNILYFQKGNVYVGPPNRTDTYYSLKNNQPLTKDFIKSGQTIPMRDAKGNRYDVKIDFLFESDPLTTNIVHESLRSLVQSVEVGDNLLFFI